MVVGSTLTVYLLLLALLLLVQFGFPAFWTSVKGVCGRYARGVVRGTNSTRPPCVRSRQSVQLQGNQPGTTGRESDATMRPSLGIRSTTSFTKSEPTYEQVQARLSDLKARIAKNQAAEAAPSVGAEIGKPAARIQDKKVCSVGQNSPHFGGDRKRMVSSKRHLTPLTPAAPADSGKALEDVARSDELWFEIYEKRDQHDEEEGDGYRFHNWRYERIVKELHRAGQEKKR
jgi:hypothetical protein